MTLESPSAEDLRMDVGALMGALWARALRIVIVTILLLVATFVILLFVPKLYESSASLLVESRDNAYTEAAGTTPTSSGGSAVTIDALMSSQIELIKSRDTLLAVVDSLDLRAVPEFNGTASSPLTALLTLIGRNSEPRSVDDTVLRNLNDRLTVIRERDSAVISIFVRSSDPELAARIANAIAAEHVRRRAGQSVSDTAEATAWLQQQIDDLRQKVKDADTKVADFKAQNGIFTGSNGTTLPDQQISDIGKQITDAQQAKNVAAQRANLIRSLLRSGQPVEGVEDVRSSPVIQSLMQNRATLQSSLAEKQATLLPAHPTIISLKTQLSQVNTQIRDEARQIAEGLEAQVKIQDGLIASLNADLARAKDAASTQTRDGVTLDSLTREANAQRALLDSYLIKYRDAAGRTGDGSVLPDVRVITQAAPSVVPASPKTGLILGAVAFVALALQIGLVLFGELMSGRAVYDRNAVPFMAEAPSDAEEPVVVSPEVELDADSLEPVLATTADPLDDELSETGIEPDLADMPEPEFAPEAPVAVAAATTELPPIDWSVASREVPQRTTPSAAGVGAMQFSSLVADIALGRVRVLLVASLAEARDAAVAADRLVDEALDRGLSVCRVDAGSGRTSQAPGLSDLCAGNVSFGDVVHKVRDGLAEVPWGHLGTLERRSMRPVTLVEALSDIYEVVIVSTGRIGLNSTLPVFSGADGRLVLVRSEATMASVVEAAMADAEALGFETVQSVMVPERQPEVA